jgi:hypothetical protein
MQVNVSKVQPPVQFQPVKLEMTFEKVEELAAFLAVLDTNPVYDFLFRHGLNPLTMKDSISSGGNVNDWTDYVKELRGMIQASAGIASIVNSIHRPQT